MNSRTKTRRSTNHRRRLLTETLESRHLLAGPYAPAAGQVGSDAIAHDDVSIVAWASRVESYAVGSDVDISFQTPGNAIGPAVSGLPATVSLGRGGTLTVTFDAPIRDGLGADFAVFENGINGTFLELGYVEVSSDGVNFFRFASDSLTPAAVDAFGAVDPTEINNLAGKYDAGFGTPFDLEELSGVSVLLDTTAVTHVRLVDVVGDGTATDASGDVIFDPFPTVGSAGLDVDAIGVIHQASVAYEVAGFEDVGATLAAGSSFSGPDPNGTTAPGPFSNTITTGTFTSETMDFNNSNESSFGAWTGWAYSNVADNTTAGFTNQFGVFTGGGASGSATFGLGFADVNGNSALPTISRDDADLRKLDSIQITNSTYAALSMQSGDQFAKKFGGATGNDPDFLLLTIDGKDAGGASIGTVDFYLADFRFDNNAMDYIVDEWTSVDLSSIENARSLEFSISSSDVGPFGVNTPAYFAADNIRFAKSKLPIDIADREVSEADGNAATIVRVSRPDNDIAKPMVVSLTTSTTGVINIPTSVTIPVGQRYVEFSVGVVDDQIAAGPKDVSIVAAANGFVDGSVSIKVVDDEVPTLTASLASSSVNEGESIDVTVGRNVADLSLPQTFQLAATPTGFLGLADSYVIPAGQSSVTLSLMAEDDNLDGSDVDVAIGVAADGFTPSTANVTVLDNDVATVTIAFDQSVLNEGAGAKLVGLEDRGAGFPLESFYNGSDLAGGFDSSSLSFNNNFNATFGSWSGWSVSNVTDTVTAGFTNQYSAFPGGGADGSETYAVASTFSLPTITRNATDPHFAEFAVSNTTYAALSMMQGDAFAKKFGGESGNDEDFFLLTIQGIGADDQSTGSIDFYLADFRFADNTLDYIVDQWTTVDLTSLGDATELQFSLSSSDVGQFGMNTPAYFAVDNIVLGDPQSLQATVSRNTVDISEPLDVYLESDDLSELRVPSVVTIPAGQSSVSVPLEVRDDVLVDGTQAVSVSASAGGNVGSVLSVSLADNDVPTLFVTARTPSVFESGTGRLLVYRNTLDVSQSTTFSVVPQTEGVVTLGASFEIPAGSRRVEIPFTANDDSDVNEDRELVFQVTSGGFIQGEASVKILNDDAPPPALTLELSGSSLSESDAAPTMGFENLGARIADGSFNNGADGAGGFSSDGVLLNNSYNSNFGSWGGWSVSKTTDQTTSGFTNQYSAITGIGAFGSEAYAVASAFSGSDSPTLTLEGPIDGRSFESLMITNTTYAAISMRDGDAFAKKFGGESGDDEDFFLLQIEGKDVDGQSVGVVDFYLADFRFADNAADYIVDQWTQVDVSSLVGATQLAFALSSSDVGDFGMNTPAYFAIDAVVLSDAPANVIMATVTRNDIDLSADLVVDLSVDDSSEIAIPASVTIPAGSRSATFEIQALDDAVLDGKQNVVIAADAPTHQSDSRLVEVLDNDKATLTATFDLAEISESDSQAIATLLVHRNTGNLSVAQSVSLVPLGFGGTPLLQLPTQVTIPAGARTVSIDVQAIDNDFGQGDQAVHINPTAVNFQSVTSSITVLDDDVVGIAFDDVPQIFFESQVHEIEFFLTSRPVSDVVINVDTSSPLTIGAAHLVFTSENWNVPQVVSVLEPFDWAVEATQEILLTLTVDANSSVGYAQISPIEIPLFVQDHEASTARVSENSTSIQLVDDAFGVLRSNTLGAGLNVSANQHSQTVVVESLVKTRGLVRVDMAGGDDVVVLRGTRFTSIDGGDGEDDLVLELPSAQYDLAGLFANRVVNFENVLVAGAGASDIVLNSETIASIADAGGMVRIKLVGDNRLSIEGDFVSQTPTLSGSEFAQVATAGGVSVEVVSERPWQNAFKRYDVDGSGLVTPNDILAVINQIADDGTGDLPALPAVESVDGRYVDVSGDGELSPADILEVINYLADAQSRVGSDRPSVPPQGELLASDWITLLDNTQLEHNAADEELPNALQTSARERVFAEFAKPPVVEEILDANLVGDLGDVLEDFRPSLDPELGAFLTEPMLKGSVPTNR
ncbi:MAG: DUF4465 domain-containing protein [Pirellulaceae bacterium]